MPDPRRAYRFRDHAVAGVNWRPTRFVDEGTPKEAVDFVHWTTSRSKKFSVSAMNYPPRRANALKVYCWNEAKGCKSEGTMESMLRHYENECTFHTLECLRCGEEVLHRELATHYVARCSAADSLAGTEKISSESGAVTFQDVMGALEEVKALWRDANCEQLLLLEIQTRMNQLVELIRNRESRLTVKTEVLAVPATSKTDQVAGPSPSTSLQEGTSMQNPTEQVSSSSTTLWCSQETLMPRQLEPLVDLPKEVLQAMRKTSWEGKLYNCEHDEGSWICQRVYHRNIDGLVRNGVLPDGMKFEIELCHN
ncbi:hypothetical protein MTO96_004555 [Rhipicephalus appendiculatus]